MLTSLGFCTVREVVSRVYHATWCHDAAGRVLPQWAKRVCQIGMWCCGCEMWKD